MNSLIDIVPELGTEVPLSQVERELKNLFASDSAVTRASLMNFAVYSEQPESLAANTALIRHFTTEHACRALVIAVKPGAEQLRIRSWVTAHCNLAANGKKSICSEQISFLIEGKSAYLVPNTVFARLDSDLPLAFWWQGDLSENFEPTLYSRIDRLIIDSGEWTDLLPQLDRLERAYRESTSHFIVLDLAWTRVLQLRLALAACFDDPHALAELPNVTEVEIAHSSTNGLDARMLGSWMMHQVGWKLIPGSNDADLGHLLESKEGRQIRLKFTTTTCTCPVSLIKLTGPNVVCEVIREKSCQFIRSRIRSANQETECLTPSTINTPAELIIERLRRGCNNRLYFTLLQTVRQLLA